jgi:hypothetical protein
MKRKCVSTILLLLLTQVINAQTEAKYRNNNNYDASFFANAKQLGSAFSWVHLHSVTKKNKFKIGYGLRFTNQFGNGLNYTTAPAKLTSKQTGPQVLFTEIYNDNIDTVFVSRAQHNLLNLSINLQYNFSENLEIGFNIDAIGFAFGKEVLGNYLAYQAPQTPNLQLAKPTVLNLLLISDNDIGGLNSELYVRYWFTKKLALKAGATFLFTEYTTSHKLRLDNNRWRNKSLMALVGVTYNPFR